MAEVIVALQQECFVDGPGRLRPLSMKVVGEQLSIHESTVTRSIRGKSLLTARGAVPFRYFFGSALTTSQGALSNQAVAARVLALIDDEDKGAPLSDHAISDQLLPEGIHFARRTVAKYRGAAGIPTGSVRKRIP